MEIVKDGLALWGLLIDSIADGAVRALNSDKTAIVLLVALAIVGAILGMQSLMGWEAR